MRIVHVVCSYPPYRGGMGNVCHELVERQRKRGHDVAVLTPSQMRPWLRYGNAALMPQFPWKLRGVDVVHLHWPFIGGAEWILFRFFSLRTYSGILKNLRIDRKGGQAMANLVVTYHMDLVGSGALTIFFKLYQWLMIPLMLRAATFVTVASLDYAEHSRWLRGRKYLVEVPYGVDEQRFTPRKFSTSLEQYASSEPSESRSTYTPTALFVAALDRAHYFKGLDVLLNAWKELGTTGQRARLRIVGDGDMRAHYEQIGQGLTLANNRNIEFLGAVPWKELPAVYQSADFLVFPSIDASEAFGLVILEAAASGLPSIVSNLPGVRMLVKEGETGLIVPPRDVHALARALRKFIADAESRLAMGDAARLRAVQKYSWDQTLDAFEWTYRLKSNPIDKLALIALQDRKILMTMSRGKDLWYLPGGKRDLGESDRDCLLREIREEVGVKLDPSSIAYYGTFEAHAHGKPSGIFVRTTCYRASYSSEHKASGEIERIALLGYGRKLSTATVAHLVFDDLKKRDLID